MQKAIAYHTTAPPAMLIALVAGRSGAVVDDLLVEREASLMGEGPWLLGVLVTGAVVFWLLTMDVGFYPAVVVTVLLVAGLRVGSVQFGWTSPFFPGRDLPEDGEALPPAT